MSGRAASPTPTGRRASTRPASSGDGLLRYYASRLTACELNNTFYQQPKPAKVDAWLAATPESFRFAVKAQRGGSFRSLAGRSGRERALADRRRCGVRRAPRDGPVPGPRWRQARRRPARRRCSRVWPRDLPLTMEFQDPSWHVDEVFAALAGAGAALCTTELPEDDGAADDPADRAVPVPATAPPRLLGARTSRRGPHGWSRSSPTGSTRSCSSATTMRGGARELALEFALTGPRRTPRPRALAGAAPASPRPGRTRRAASAPR